MALRLVLWVALAALASVEAKPRYIAIPLQDIRLVRHARSVPSDDAPSSVPYLAALPVASNVRQGRYDPAPYEQPSHLFLQRDQRQKREGERASAYLARHLQEGRSDQQRTPVYSRLQERAGQASQQRTPVYGFLQEGQASERVPIYAQPQAAYAEGADEDVLLPDGSDRYERQAGHHGGGYGGGNDHVDYGAYTGGYGAFGWYSDHPVCINCGYHRRR
ncbi:uncharacterized protein LOC135203708 [Macrobrachium nipponense]|uniref:uncharacterized protein LOC135203708 n=1 Tax=Macrobrachium nipponense TaxID=159736 RepID=UPI0030C7D66B